LSRPMRLASAFGAPGAPSALSRWFGARLDDAAEGLAVFAERLRPRRKLVLTEQPDGALVGDEAACRLEGGRLAFFQSGEAALRGAEVEFRLSDRRFLFRDIELPARAGEFLEGVVRSQIDRLTPWRAQECVFGWSAPSPLDAGRIGVVIAATKRAPVAPLIEIEADAVTVTCARAGQAPIVVLKRRAGAAARRERWRVGLVAALAFALLAGAAAAGADWTLGQRLRAETDALTQRLASERAALLRRGQALDDPALQALDAKKRATPAVVVVLEALTRALPDQAYLTEMQVKGDRLEIGGRATDAAALVKHIEQSPHFSAAAFIAPTTRGADARETFRIAAHVAPLLTVPP
jgi:general secretion pathway protein L